MQRMCALNAEGPGSQLQGTSLSWNILVVSGSQHAVRSQLLHLACSLRTMT